MKKLFELLVCFLHPLAVVLMWIDLAVDRPDLKRGGKLAWGTFGLVPLVPFLYVLTGGDLWLSRQLAFHFILTVTWPIATGIGTNTFGLLCCTGSKKAGYEIASGL